MASLCPACGAANQDTARFCDQCRAPLTAEAAQAQVPADAPNTATQVTPEATRSARGGLNWVGLAIVALVIAGGVWLLYKPDTSAAPAGSSAGKPSEATQSMQNAQEQLAAAKSKLEKDPLDVQALDQLYILYGQIGQSEKVRPQLDAALAAWTKAHPEPTKADLQDLAAISMAALDGNDFDAAIDTLELYYTHTPGSLTLSLMLGNLSRDAGQPERALRWYDEYLKTAKPEAQHDDYWGAVAKRARMQLELAKAGRRELAAAAVAELERMTAAVPKLWQGWQALGLAYRQQGNKEKALQAFTKSEAAATAPHDKWEAQVQLAELQGKPAPEEPVDHSSMGGMMNPHGGITNPHGDMGSPHQGMTNPHGGGANPDEDTDSEPDNPHAGSA